MKNIKDLEASNVSLILEAKNWKTSVPNYVIASLTWKNVRYFLPALIWVILFTSYPSTPIAIRPTINISFLPFAEESIFGTQVHKQVYRPDHDSTLGKTLDLAAALAYFLHFFLPFSFGIVVWILSLFKKGPNNQLEYVWAFGLTSALAVLTHYFFPMAPPWYYDKYGFQTPNYYMKGDPAGLSYADKLLNMNFFQNIYENSPVVFGSLPSLHAAWPLLVFLFTPSPFKIISGVYVIWVWWAAMYLNHHYLIDILAGAIYVLFAYNLSFFMSSTYTAIRTKIHRRSASLGSEPSSSSSIKKKTRRSKHDDRLTFTVDSLDALELGEARIGPSRSAPALRDLSV